MVVSAHQVAAELRQRQPNIGRVQVHKLLYYCQGYHLATFGAPLFGERLAAWDLGPVVPSLWQAEQEDSAFEGPALDDEAMLNTIGFVMSRYGGLTGTELTSVAHSESPWVSANRRRQQKGQRSVVIPRSDLEEHFSAVLAEDASEVDTDALEALLGAPGARTTTDSGPETMDHLDELLGVRG